MTGHVVLNRDEVRSILSLYHLDELEDYGDMTEGDGNTAYWVQVSGRRYFLRITEKKRMADLVFEKSLLEHLRSKGLAVPEPMRNVAKGSFIPWSSRGRYVSLFKYIAGRELGIFELRPKHLRQVGDFLGRMHQLTTGFEMTKPNESSLEGISQRLERLLRAREKGRLAARYEEDLNILADGLDAQWKVDRSGVPMGPVHGELFTKNVWFSRDALRGVIDFEMACTERSIWDLAVVVNAWCWQPSPRQRGGPAGHFAKPRLRALLEAYERIRPLSPAERTLLLDEARLAALRFAVGRLLDFELKKPDSGYYRDYRHFMQRYGKLAGSAGTRLFENVFSVAA